MTTRPPGIKTRLLPLQGGFVLVSVLLIVALATVLVIVASMMAQVERRAAANSVKVEQARGNALFALDVALGRLQADAGPDQRISARAEILDDTEASTHVTGVNQPYWTGIWRTGTNHLDAGSSPQRQLSLGSITPTKSQIAGSALWLVSGTNVNPLTFVGTTNGAAKNAVVLASSYGPTSTNVTVPLVPITHGGRTNGAYGYWVSDEGVKARVDQSSPTLAASNFAENKLHFATAQAMPQSTGLLGANNAVDFRNPSTGSDLSKITTIASMQNLPGIAAGSLGGDEAARMSAHATTRSVGVFSDVRRGGLKKDLTAAFEDSGNTPGANYAELNPGGMAQVYSAVTDAVGAAQSSYAVDGLKWISLYSHYNLYKGALPLVNMAGRVLNPAGSTPGGIGNPEGSRPFQVAMRALGWQDATIPNGAQISYGMLAPTFLGYRWDTSISSKSEGASYKLQLHYYFQIILHNPYSVAIVSPLRNFRYGRALAAAGNIYLETRVTTGGTSSWYYTAVNQGATLQRMIFSTAFDDTSRLEPGETRVFGLGSAVDGLTVKQACEYRDTVAPYGFVSSGYSPTFARSAELQRISNLGADANADTYAALPDIAAGSEISLRLTLRPTAAAVSSPGTPTNPSSRYTIDGSGSADVSIPQAAMWWTDGGQGGSVLGAIAGRAGSVGRRMLQSSAPGSIPTGGSGSIARPTFGPVPVETLSETQVLGMFIRRKGLIPSNSAQYTNSSLVIPLFCGNSAAFNPIQDLWNWRYWDELFVGRSDIWPSYPPASSEIQLDLTSGGLTTTSWGERSAGVDTPGERRVLIDIPIQPMVSLGQFMHMQPAYTWNTGAYTSLSFGSMFVGGSLPSAEVPLSQTAFDAIAAQSQLFLDHSYLANQALFDSYFFSTVPPSSPPPGTRWPEYWTEFNAANNGPLLTDLSKPLLNTRIKPFLRGGAKPAMADLRDMERAAANLLLDGAFNINSTSVEAWVALLSSQSGVALTLFDAGDDADRSLSVSTLQNPITRFTAGNSNSEVNQRWSGVRALDSAQTRQLAEKIVEQVKLRGPFLSMSDFLNRRLGPASDITRAGTLQAAIDRTSLNDAIKTGHPVNVTSSIASAVAAGWPRPLPENMVDASSASGSPWDSAIGAPGYLLQQDLVQSLSPIMTARSDTFIVRVYGEVRNPSKPTASPEALARGEAVLQRVPTFVDPSDPPEKSVSQISGTNAAFGRRFQVVSFRWLSENES